MYCGKKATSKQLFNYIMTLQSEVGFHTFPCLAKGFELMYCPAMVDEGEPYLSNPYIPPHIVFALSKHTPHFHVHK